MHIIKSLFVIALLGLSLQSFAASAPPYSAVRGEFEDWRIRLDIQRGFFREMESKTSAENVAQKVDKADLTKVIAWTDYAEIEKYFKQVRDLRFVTDPSDVKNLRRSTWMYPDDGCFARAQLMEENLKADGHTQTSKIFVFGNLNVKSSNAIGGRVSWWYHVAPIVSDGTDTYVIDPAIDPAKPLKVADWLKTMGNVKNMTISICDTNAYTPFSDCYKPSPTESSYALDDQGYYLDSERQRIRHLGRDDEKELGDFPPWLEAALSPLP